MLIVFNTLAYMSATEKKLRTRKFYLVFLLFLFAAPRRLLAQDTTVVKQQAALYTNAIVNSDLKIWLQYTYHRIYEMNGGKDDLMDKYKKGVEGWRLQGLTYSNIFIGKAGEFYISGKEINCLFPIIVALHRAASNVRPESYLVADVSLLATSDKDGKKWTFFIIDQGTIGQVPTVFPGLNKQLQIPPPSGFKDISVAMYSRQHPELSIRDLAGEARTGWGTYNIDDSTSVDFPTAPTITPTWTSAFSKDKKMYTAYTVIKDMAETFKMDPVELEQSKTSFDFETRIRIFLQGILPGHVSLPEITTNRLYGVPDSYCFYKASGAAPGNFYDNVQAYLIDKKLYVFWVQMNNGDQINDDQLFFGSVLFKGKQARAYLTEYSNRIKSREKAYEDAKVAYRLKIETDKANAIAEEARAKAENAKAELEKKFLGYYKTNKAFGNDHLEFHRNGLVIARNDTNNSSKNVKFLHWDVNTGGDTIYIDGGTKKVITLIYTQKGNTELLKSVVISREHVANTGLPIVCEKTSSDPYVRYRDVLPANETRGSWREEAVYESNGTMVKDGTHFWDIYPSNDQIGEFVTFNNPRLFKPVPYDSLSFIKYTLQNNLQQSYYDLRYIDRDAQEIGFCHYSDGIIIMQRGSNLYCDLKAGPLNWPYGPGLHRGYNALHNNILPPFGTHFAACSQCGGRGTISVDVEKEYYYARGNQYLTHTVQEPRTCPRCFGRRGYYVDDITGLRN